jgi:hypothetical protein
MLRKAVVIAILVILGIVGAASYMLQLRAFLNMDPPTIPLQRARVHSRLIRQF